jgi:LuxR family maltose regulon positive regulatory protein
MPGVPSWLVPRPRLEERIAQGAQGPVTTVTGPPGAGKTMALALWAAARPPAGALAWVTLDDYDNRPRVFWSYVLAALRRAGVAVPRALAAAPRRYAVDHELLLRFASLMAAQEPPVTLVLDDMHLLTTPKVVDGLAYVLRNARPGLRLVAGSRIDPLFPLHRYRLAGELTEIRARDLAFSIPEAGQLMARHDVVLSPESLERLSRRAEGWVAVMRLAAISMAGHPDPEQFVKELIAEDSAVAGYLVEEVLNAQPVQVRNFLLRTSILDRMSEDLAAELAGDGSDASVLPELAQANAFVQRDDSGWYRYHALFAAVLRLKLRRDDPGRVPGLHLRAAGWYRRNGSLREAVRHAADAGDWQFAARTVLDELAVARLIEPGGDEALAGAFRQMPGDGSWTDPQPLLVTAAIGAAQGQDARSVALMRAAEDMLADRSGEEEIPSRLAAALIRLALGRRCGDLGAAAAAADRSRLLLNAIPADQLARQPAIEPYVLAGYAAVRLWSGDFAEAAATFEAGAAAARTPDSESELAACIGHLALIEALSGRLSRAAELAEAVVRPEDETGRPAGPRTPAAEVALATVHLERNELSRSRSWYRRAREALRSRPDRLIDAAAGLTAARRCLAGGHGRAALEIAARVRQGWSPPAWIGHRLLLLDSSAYLMMGDFPSAADAASRAGPTASLGAAAALAAARLAAGNPEAATEVLASAPWTEETTDSVRLMAWLTDAQLSFGRGEDARGRQSLERALRLGEPEQHRLPFVMERSWLRQVLRRDPELAHRHRRLLEPGLAGGGQAGALPPAGEPAPVIVEQLSAREREVLQHVSALESTAEIAAAMYISVNTVKTHLKSIYRKLAATHRGEAVRNARRLGLL